MKVIKPGKLSVLTRCFEYQRRFFLGVSALAFVPMTRTETQGQAEEGMLTEVGMWTFVADRLGKEAVLDASIPKAKAEFIVSGIAHTPGGEAQPHLAVRARVAERDKVLYVFGDRYWQGSRASAPQPFSQMPIDWAHAYGGPKFERNPLGKGHEEVLIEGTKIKFLPNIESPHKLLDSPRRAVEPAGFMPLDIAWPQRTALAGTYDQNWLETLFPGFARDVDWAIHNVAQPDQRLERQFHPGDVYEFENLHPKRPLVSGQLPNLLARAFITRKPTGPEQLTEINLSLQTLWAFPDAERMVLIFTGSTPVSEEDGTDVSNLVVAAERGGAPKAVEHYASILATRLDPEKGAIAALDDAPLLPADLPDLDAPEFAEEQELGATEGLLQANLFRKAEQEFAAARALVASFGLDPDLHGPPAPTPPAPPPSPQELPGIVEKLQAEAEAKRVADEAAQAQRQAEIDSMVDSLAIPGFDSSALAEERSQSPVGPPTFTAEGQRAMLAGLAADGRARGMVIDEIEEMIVDEALFAHWLDAEQRMREGYRLTAHLQNPAPAMPDEQTVPCQARVRAAIAEGESFAKLNLTGADLRGMDLAGADLSGAFLESARLDNANLRGAKLEGAVLAHASLVSVDLEGASLERANLGKATLSEVRLAGAKLGEAVLVETAFERVSLERAILVDADLTSATFVETDASFADARKLNLLRGDFSGLRLHGADLRESNLLELNLDGVDLSEAKLDTVTFLKCSAKGANFHGASLDNARFVEGCVLDDAVLTEAKLTNATVRATSLERANLRRATLDNSDFSESNLREAKLYQAVARQARFVKAELGEAEMMSANLMMANLARARIHGVDFRGANLYGADMARVQTDARVQTSEANLTKVRIHPRYDPSSDPDSETSSRG